MRLFGLIVLCGLASFLFAGCQTEPQPRPENKAISVDPISQKVESINTYSNKARLEILAAKSQFDNANINDKQISLHLENADRALQTQQLQIREANQEIFRLTKATALSQKQYNDLLDISRQWEREADRYERKYLKLTKYRWAIYSLLGVSSLIVLAKIKGILM